MEGFRAGWAARDLFDRGGAVELRLISSHRHVMNLLAEDWGQLLMLADPGMYKGPASVGLGQLEFGALQACLKPGDRARFRDEGIEFPGRAGLSLSLASAERLSFSPPPALECDRSFVASAALAATMAEFAAPHLCSCLFGESGAGPSSAARDPFAGTLAREFPRFLEALLRGDQAQFDDSASSLVGLGYGSTPTADDLMHGALIAGHYLERAGLLDGPPLRLPRSIQERTTLLGSHMLEMGGLGLAPAPLRDFGQRLLAGKNLETNFAELRRMGSDSGCSMAVGFYLFAAGCQGPALPEGRLSRGIEPQSP